MEDKKDYRERYKKIFESEWFKETHENMSVGEVIKIEEMVKDEVQQEIKDTLCEMEYDDSVLFENPSYSSAAIGVSNDGRVIYDYDLMVDYLIANNDMEYDDAVDFINYITLRALPYLGERGPIVMSGFDYLR